MKGKSVLVKYQIFLLSCVRLIMGKCYIFRVNGSNSDKKKGFYASKMIKVPPKIMTSYDRIANMKGQYTL